jgi:hypothetical protein
VTSADRDISPRHQQTPPPAHHRPGHTSPLTRKLQSGSLAPASQSST